MSGSPIFLYGVATWAVSIIKELWIKEILSTTVQSTIENSWTHIPRKQLSIKRLVVQGQILGKRSRGRPPTRWTDRIEQVRENSITGCSRDTNTRLKWRHITEAMIQVVRNKNENKLCTSSLKCRPLWQACIECLTCPDQPSRYYYIGIFLMVIRFFWEKLKNKVLFHTRKHFYFTRACQTSFKMVDDRLK